jgi:hypothetical protein
VFSIDHPEHGKIGEVQGDYFVGKKEFVVHGIDLTHRFAQSAGRNPDPFGNPYDRKHSNDYAGLLGPAAVRSMARQLKKHTGASTISSGARMTGTRGKYKAGKDVPPLKLRETADDLIRAVLEGRKVPAFLGNRVTRTDPDSVSSTTAHWDNPAARRVADRWDNSGLHPDDKIIPSDEHNTVFKSHAKTKDEYDWRRRVDKHVVRRMTKTGIIGRDGKDIVKGPNYSQYNKVNDANRPFIQPHDVAQHGALGVRGDWDGENHISHMDHIVAHLDKFDKITPGERLAKRQTLRVPTSVYNRLVSNARARQ